MTEAQLDTLQNLWVRADFMTLVNISLSYQKIINIQYTFALPHKFCRVSRCAYAVCLVKSHRSGFSLNIALTFHI